MKPRVTFEHVAMPASRGDLLCFLRTEHDQGDEDLRRPPEPCCDLCGAVLRWRADRQVPLWALEDAIETAIICLSPECFETARRVYRVSSKRVRVWRFEDRDDYAARMFRDAIR